MDKNDILDYVTKTPGNTNRAVLGSMLDSVGGSGGGASNFIVNVVAELIDTEWEVASIDKTLNEVITAINNDEIVVAKIDFSNGSVMFAPLTLYDASEEYCAFSVCEFGGGNTSITINDYMLGMAPDGNYISNIYFEFHS